MGGTLIFPFGPIAPPPSLPPPPPTLPLCLCLHSWPSSLLSSNCSSVLGNGGRKSQSFRRATMTIKNIFFGEEGEEKRKKALQLGREKGGGVGAAAAVGGVGGDEGEKRQKGRPALVMVVNP